VNPGLRRAILGLAIAGLAAGLAALALELTSDHEDVPAAVAALSIAVGWSFLGVGLFAWLRRPDNRMGPIMTGAGFGWFLPHLVASNSAPFFTAGLLLENICIPLAFGLVAFPTGRIPTRPERLVVGATWLWATALTVPLALVTVPSADAPENLVLIGDGAGLEDPFDTAHTAIIGVLALGLIGALALRWRDSTTLQRREMAPVVGAGAVALTLLVARPSPTWRAPRRTRSTGSRRRRSSPSPGCRSASWPAWSGRAWSAGGR
jgi:hypothetical protein